MFKARNMKLSTYGVGIAAIFVIGGLFVIGTTVGSARADENSSAPKDINRQAWQELGDRMDGPADGDRIARRDDDRRGPPANFRDGGPGMNRGRGGPPMAQGDRPNFHRPFPDGAMARRDFLRPGPGPNGFHRPLPRQFAERDRRGPPSWAGRNRWNGQPAWRDGRDGPRFARDGYRDGFRDGIAWARDGRGRDGWGRDGWGRDGFNRGGFGPDRYAQNRFGRDGFRGDGFGRDGFARPGFDRGAAMADRGPPSRGPQNWNRDDGRGPPRGPAFAQRGFGPPPRDGMDGPGRGNHIGGEAPNMVGRLDQIEHRIDALIREISDLKREPPPRPAR